MPLGQGHSVRRRCLPDSACSLRDAPSSPPRTFCSLRAPRAADIPSEFASAPGWGHMWSPQTLNQTHQIHRPVNSGCPPWELLPEQLRADPVEARLSLGGLYPNCEAAGAEAGTTQTAPRLPAPRLCVPLDGGALGNPDCPSLVGHLDRASASLFTSKLPAQNRSAGF